MQLFIRAKKIILGEWRDNNTASSPTLEQDFWYVIVWTIAFSFEHIVDLFHWHNHLGELKKIFF